MPRPKKFRLISSNPSVVYFKPSGIPKNSLEQIILMVDELEAIKLADLESLYQEDAAKKMNISRQTFGNILASAHRKIADFLVNGKALKVEGGVIRRLDEESCQCGYRWNPNNDEQICPNCNTPRQRNNRFRRRKGMFYNSSN